MSIKVGDLVQVVHECCDPGTVRGCIGTVLEMDRGFFECEDCFHRDHGMQARISGLAEQPDTPTDSLGWVPMSWLKRIPPLEELEDEKRDEKLTEPA